MRRERLAQAGLDLARVELIERTADVAAHLALYQGIDVALDTFPYHGTTTTCEALWMGVPVVTLAGDRHASRVGVSLLQAAGHPEWVEKALERTSVGDVWGIGTTLYLLLTDRLPFDMPDNIGWGTKNLFDQDVVPPSQINPDANKALDTIVLKALQKRAEDRYPTAKELLDSLDGWKPVAQEPAPKSKALSSEPSKTVFGLPSPADDSIAQDLAQKAFKARQTGRLADAADLMEEAFNKSPELRQKYAHHVKLWRCGISM